MIIWPDAVFSAGNAKRFQNVLEEGWSFHPSTHALIGLAVAADENDFHFRHINTDLPKYLSRPTTSTHRSWITRFAPEFPKSLSNRKCATTWKIKYFRSAKIYSTVGPSCTQENYSSEFNCKYYYKYVLLTFSLLFLMLFLCHLIIFTV